MIFYFLKCIFDDDDVYRLHKFIYNWVIKRKKKESIIEGEGDFVATSGVNNTPSFMS